MIASSSPNTKAATAPKVPQANPSILPSGSIYDYRFTAGPYAGMTYQEVVKYLQNYSQSVNQATNGKPSKPMTGSTQGDQALGLVGGIGTAAAVRYGIGQLGSQALAEGGSQALAQGGSQALAQGGSQAVGSAANGGTMLANGAVEGGSQAAGGASTALSSAGPYLAAAAWGYDQYKTAPGQYQLGQQYKPKEAGWQSVKQDWGDNKGALDWGKSAYDLFTGQTAMNAYYATTGSLFGSKRAAERQARKGGRLALQNAGLLGPDSRSQYLLQDGGKFDIRDYREKTGDHAFNINWNDPNVNHDKIGFLEALTTAILGNKGRAGDASSALTGELYNAYNSNGKLNENSRAAGDQLGGRDAIYQGILDQWKNKTIDAEKRDANLAAIDKEYGIANPTGARWDSTLQGKELDRNVKELAEADKKKAEAEAKAQANRKPVENKNPSVKPTTYKNPRFK